MEYDSCHAASNLMPDRRVGARALCLGPADKGHSYKTVIILLRTTSYIRYIILEGKS